MTADEQTRILGEMVEERRALRKTIACIKHQFDWATTELVRAGRYIQFAQEGSISGKEARLDYPSADELMDTLEEYRTATVRLKEINARLDC